MLLKVKKPLALLLAVFVCLSVLIGCSTSDGNSDVDDEDLAVENTDNQTDEKHHNLSADGSIQVSEDIDNDAILILEQSLETNSHEIETAENSV